MNSMYLSLDDQIVITHELEISRLDSGFKYRKDVKEELQVLSRHLGVIIMVKD